MTRTPSRLIAAFAATAAALVASIGGAATASAANAPPPTAPLSSSLVVSGTTFAEVAMGKTSQPSTTYWQSVALDRGQSRWRLVTPPGVADNGGLVAGANGGAAVLNGFVASGDLGFSPLASSADGGRDWSPGVLPGALSAVPDALSGSGYEAVALLRSPQRVVVSTSDDLSSWRVVGSAAALSGSSAGRRCGVGTLSGAALAGSLVLAATSCRVPGEVGLFEDSASGWRAAAVVSSPLLAGARIDVLRLYTAAGAASALLEANAEGRRFLLAVHRDAPGAAFSLSGAAPLARGETVAASGTTAAGAYFALLDRAGARRAVVLAPVAKVTALRSPPPGTSTLAFSPSRTYALVAAQSRLTVYALGGLPPRWREVQVLDVPISYGSSS